MIVGPHSTKLPQSWDTGSDQPSVPAQFFPTWQRAKPRTLAPTFLTLFWFQNLMSGHDLIQTGEFARLLLFTSWLYLVFISSLQGKSLDCSCLLDQSTVPVILSIDYSCTQSELSIQVSAWELSISYLFSFSTELSTG